MPHPTILSTARQSQLGETLATNNYSKAYIEPLLASSNDLNTFSQRCKAALANTVIPSKNPKEQAVPTVMKDQGQSHALIEQVKNCAIQSLGVVGNQIQKSMEGLEAWCKLVSDEIEWEAKEMQFITERLSSSREIVGRKGAGDLIAAQSTPLPPKIQQLSEPVKTLTPSSLSLNLDALSTIGTQLPQSLLGPNGMFGNQATTISRTDDSSRRSFTSTIAAAAKIPEIVSPLSEEVDVPPPPPPDEGMSDFPPPPSNYGDIPPPSDFGDIPPPPMDFGDIPPPPNFGDVPPPPMDFDDMPPPPMNFGNMPPPPTSILLPPAPFGMASNVPPPTSSTSEIPKFDFFPTTQTNLVDPMANMNISGGKRPPQPPAAQPRAKVIYAYQANDHDEMSINVGEVLQILALDAGEGWTMAGSLDGKRRGLVPKSYLEMM